ncbi:MAG: hypothetical protein ACRDC6_27955 [Shewanella sp.]|nr:hypothetical protein [Salmonella enterica]
MSSQLYLDEQQQALLTAAFNFLKPQLLLAGGRKDLTDISDDVMLKNSLSFCFGTFEGFYRSSTIELDQDKEIDCFIALAYFLLKDSDKAHLEFALHNKMINAYLSGDEQIFTKAFFDNRRDGYEKAVNWLQTRDQKYTTGLARILLSMN